MELDGELPVPEPEACELLARRLGEGLGSLGALLAERRGEIRVAGLRCTGGCLGRRERVGASVECGQLVARRRGPLDQLRGRSGTEAALRVGDLSEALLDVLEPAGLGLERGEEAA